MTTPSPSDEWAASSGKQGVQPHPAGTRCDDGRGRHALHKLLNSTAIVTVSKHWGLTLVGSGHGPFRRSLLPSRQALGGT